MAASMTTARIGSVREEKVVVHSVPCQVQVEGGVGDARVKRYFVSSVHSGSDGGYRASLRGRPLSGAELQVPPNYVGLVLKEVNHCAQEGRREVMARGTFVDMVYWSLTLPNSEHRLPQALSWPHIAEALHSPLPVDT